MGLALSPIHNLWLTKLTTNAQGEPWFFLPAFATAAWIMGSLFLMVDYWKEISWGDRRVYVPLLIIVGAIGLSGVTEQNWGARLAPLGMGISLFSLYLVSRKLGKDFLWPLAIGVAVGSLGILTYAAVNPGHWSGGYVFEYNFDIATGYILLGAALFIHKWRWLLASLSIVALLFTGAPEAIFAIGVLAIVAVVRRDLSWKTGVLMGVVALLAVVGLISGWGQPLYDYVTRSITGAPMARYENLDGVSTYVSPLAIRMFVIRDAMTHILPFGDGYNLTRFTVHTVHNVPLIIVQQLGWAGIVAGAAWLWVSVWCLRKTKWVYAWILVLTLSVFDHYIFDQIGPWWWCLAGVSTAPNGIDSDLVFRKGK